MSSETHGSFALDLLYLIRYHINVKIVIYYAKSGGESPFKEWILTLKDKTAANAILSRLSMVAVSAHFGDHRRLQNAYGLFEMRIHAGPGYRVYYGLDGNTIVVVLAGGLKRDQDRDIKRAVRYWTDYLESKDE